MTPGRRRVLAAAGAGAMLAGCGVAPPAGPPPGRDVTRPGGPGLLLDLGAAIDWSPLPPRRVRAWLPALPAQAPRGGWAVLYLHDGQNLFDPADSIAHGAWDVDRTLQRSIAAGAVRPTMVVAIDNAREDRSLEYGPQAPLMALPPELRAAVPRPGRGGATDPRSDAYVDALARRLKPWVDARFPTDPSPGATGVCGSSMGGLVSLYAVCRHPTVFGLAAALSTHWPVATSPAMYEPSRAAELDRVAAAVRDGLVAALPPPGRHRLWMDHGDQGLDALYPPRQSAFDAALRARGWTQGPAWTTRAYPGTGHDERWWRERLDDPLRFLLGVRPSS